MRVGEVEKQAGRVKGGVELGWAELGRLIRVGGEKDLDGDRLCGRRWT